MEYIVTQNETCTVVSDEVLADDESLCETVWRRLLRIFETHSEIGAVTEQTLESRKILRCGYDEDIPYSRQHEGGNGVVDHRLVVDGQQLLAYPLCNRV